MKELSLILLGALIAIVIMASALSGVLQMTRQQFVVGLVTVYEIISGKTAPVVVTPFVDIGGLLGNTYIAKAYGLKLTAGCADNLFCPDNKVTVSQVLRFASNLSVALWGW